LDGSHYWELITASLSHVFEQHLWFQMVTRPVPDKCIIGNWPTSKIAHSKIAQIAHVDTDEDSPYNAVYANIFLEE
jgi:hypothetical protein